MNSIKSTTDPHPSVIKSNPPKKIRKSIYFDLQFNSPFNTPKPFMNNNSLSMALHLNSSQFSVLLCINEKNTTIIFATYQEINATSNQESPITSKKGVRKVGA